MAPFCETFVLYCGLGPLSGAEQRFSVVGYNRRLINATPEARRDGRVRQGGFPLARDFAAELPGELFNPFQLLGQVLG